LEPHVAGFADGLLRHGYSRSSAEQHVCFVAHLDRWMQAARVGVGGLSEPVIERYLAERRAAGYVEYRSLKAMRPLLGYLAPLAVLPVPAEVRPDTVEELLGRYRDYLLVERGLTAGTVRGYVDFVRPFVATRLRGDVLDLAGMTQRGARCALTSTHRQGGRVVGEQIEQHGIGRRSLLVGWRP
jgi:integrase/recombinase XerD